MFGMASDNITKLAGCLQFMTDYTARKYKGSEEIKRRRDFLIIIILNFQWLQDIIILISTFEYKVWMNAGSVLRKFSNN